jgi:peptidoglycan/xylan/chitin deacetylase (PgdA/CDA1 family)
MVRSLQALLACVAALALVGWGRPAPVRIPAPRWSLRAVEVPILEYHRVGLRRGLPNLTVAPPQFAAEMEWLHGAGYHAISLGRLLAALELDAALPPRPVVITFDDGYRDILWNAAPLLHRLHMRAAAFVITDRVGGPDSSFLDWQELARLEALGFTIGSHTVHHVVLTGVSREQAYRELRESRLDIERHLRVRVWSIAYPLGRADARVAELAARAGYLLGVTERPGVAQRIPLLLDRFEILPTTGVGGVRALVESVDR